MCQNYYAVSFVAAADKEMGRVGEREREWIDAAYILTYGRAVRLARRGREVGRYG